MADYVNIKGYRRSPYINGVSTSKWFIFYVTRKPYAQGVTGMETARLEVHEEVFNECGPPQCNRVYEVIYGPHDTLHAYSPVPKDS